MQMSGEASKDYLPVLDGLRAISILLVFFSHCNKTTQAIFPGTLGVNIFFVISGFLITRQMIAEIEASGSFDVKRFYFMRLLRLFPTLLLYLAIFVPVLLYLGASITFTQVLSGIFYFANYYHIYIGYPPYNPVPILWSLAVEEHYYIVFPFLMLAFIKKPKTLLLIIIALLVAVPVWRAVLYQICDDHALTMCGIKGSVRTQATDAIFDCILYGVLAALALHYYKEETRKLLINRRSFLWAIVVLLLSLLIRSAEFRATLRYSFQSASSAVIIMNLLLGEAGTLKDWLESKIMVFIGKISYPLYLMHFGVFITIVSLESGHELNSTVPILAYLLASLVLACAAYFIIEKPLAVIRRRLRMQYEQRPQALLH